MRNCPPAEQLEQLLETRLDPGEQDTLARHVQGCPSCQDRLEGLTSNAGPDSWRCLEDRLDPSHEPQADFLTRLQNVLSPLHAAGDYPPGDHPDSSLQQPPDAPPTVPGYVILGELGRGGMGVVYKARQVRLNRLVALKMILTGAHAGPKELDRFRREAEAVACLQHPHIVQIYEVGEHGGRPYLALELVEGCSLAQYLDGKPQPARVAATLMETLARTVHYAHQRGIIHRDLKPGNVLLANAGAGPAGSYPPLATCTPKITDFGLAKRLAAGPGAGLTHSGQILGTPSYMAPEQAAPNRFPSGQGKGAEVTAAADVYSLGAILYELLTGRPPFVGETALDTVFQVLHEEPVSLCRLQPRVPRDLETITLKCLHKDPGRRYPSALALAEDLRRFLAGEPIQARPAPLWERAGKWVRRHPAGAALVAGVLLCAGLGFGILTQAWQRAEAEARAEQQAREVEAQARRGAERQKASLLIDRYLALCEQGEVSQGLLGLAHTLTLLPTDATELQHVIRANLAAWRYRLISPQQSFLQPNALGAVAFSPDGRTLVTGSQDKTARLWDVATGQPLGPPLPHKGEVRVVAFRPDGRAVLTGSVDQTARLWDAATGQPLGPPLVHEGEVVTGAFSPDGRAVLTASKDHMARLWDATTHRLVGAPLAHQHEVVAVAFSPDGQLFLSGSLDDTARLWEVAARDAKEEGTPVCRFTLPHQGPVRAVAFSPDGRLAVTGSEDGTACLWDIATGKLHGQPLRHSNAVWTVAFNPDGKTLLTGSGLVGKRQGEVRLWDVATGQSIAVLPHDGRVRQAVVSPGGRHFLSLSEDKATLWLEAGDKPCGIPVPHGHVVRAVAFSPDGRTFVTSGRHLYGPHPENKVVIWHPPVDQTGGPSLHHSYPQVLAVAFSPDGRKALTGCAGTNTGEARLWDVATGQPSGAPLAHRARVWTVGFSPDGTKLLTGGHDRKVRLWDAATGQLVGAPWPHPGELRTVAFSPDGRTAVTGGSFDAAFLWDVALDQRAPLSFRHDEFVPAVAFSPDGRFVLTGSLDATARLWDVATGQPHGEPLAHQRPVRHVTFSPNGQLAATCSVDRTAQLWDPAAALPLGPPLLHPDMVAQAAFSPDGRLLATVCGGAGTARFWDVDTRKPIGAPLPQAAWTLAFGPDGRVLVTGGLDGTARFWKVPASVVGDAARVLLWVQVLTGAELDASGTVRTLDLSTWQERRQRLQTWGGAPLP